MTKNRLLLVLVLFFSFIGRTFSQVYEGKFVIITFEDAYKISQHVSHNYYWIIAQDSLKPANNNFAHLFLESFSRNDLEDCCSAKPIDPFVTTRKSDHAFDSSYFSALDDLVQILVKKRTLLQKITKKWTSGQQEEIKIFATPVSGTFCIADFHPIGQERYGYTGKVALPRSSFVYHGDFWSSGSKAKLIEAYDFSRITFDIIPY